MGEMVNVPASTALRHYGGRPAPLKYSPDVLKERLLQLGVRRAARHEKVFHVVLHPIDFTLPSDERLFNALESFVETVSDARANGSVQVMTLSEVADAASFPDSSV
jgi:hypothetical protein